MLAVSPGTGPRWLTQDNTASIDQRMPTEVQMLPHMLYMMKYCSARRLLASENSPVQPLYTQRGPGVAGPSFD